MTNLKSGECVRYVGERILPGMSYRKRYRVKVVRRHQHQVLIEDRNHNLYEVDLEGLQLCQRPKAKA